MASFSTRGEGAELGNDLNRGGEGKHGGEEGCAEPPGGTPGGGQRNRGQPDRPTREWRRKEVNRYDGYFAVIWILVGGQNGKNHDGPEEGLVLLLLGID